MRNDSKSGLISSGPSHRVFGYACGILAGVTYGLNPFFGKPLLMDGVSVNTMLFFRYFISVLLLGGWMILKKETFRLNKPQIVRVSILGILLGLSSLFLFTAYKYIGAGLATTIIFMYPVLVAVIMTFMRVYPTWQVWLSIIFTTLGVVILSKPSAGEHFAWQGVILSGASALVYAMYLVIINRSRRLRTVGANALTFYALLVGTMLYVVHSFGQEGAFLAGLDHTGAWLNLLGLAVFPTMVSMLALAVSTREVGPVKTSILGVFEPVTAIFIGTVVFHESLTVNVIVGIVITMVSVLFMIASSKK